MMNRSYIFLFLLSLTVLSLSFSGHTYDAHDLEYFKQTKTCNECDFNSLDLSPVMLETNVFNNANLSGTYLYGTVIENLELQYLKASSITGLGLTLHNNDLTGADFSYSDLPFITITPFNYGLEPSFKGSTLDNGHFAYTAFEAPNFSGAAMSRASLYRVEWPHANLAEARLYAADLTYANLQYANLQQAILTSALLSHADLTGANLLDAELTIEQLNKAKSICGATLPDGKIGGC